MDELKSAKRQIFAVKTAFTLAEMMVVMLVMSIILAAMGPVITTRMRDSNESSSPWFWHESDAYTKARIAMIGQSKEETDRSAKFVINADNDISGHILFKHNDVVHGYLRMLENGLIIGNASEGTGSQNTAISKNALLNNTSGTGNTAVGVGTIQANTTGSYNTALGLNALNKNQSGLYNTAVGTNALASSESNSYNIGIGNQALYKLTNGNYNVAIGYNSLYSVQETSNTSNRDKGEIAIGAYSLEKNTTGTSNTAIGYRALNSNLSGHSNVALGLSALKANTTGYSNTAIGNETLVANTTGHSNTAVGLSALHQNTTGNQNTAIGYGACLYVKGSNKICIGNNSGPLGTIDWAKADDDAERIFIGSRSLYNNGPAVLEVHNEPSKPFPNCRIADGQVCAPGSAVVINGALIVKGGIMTSMPNADNNKFSDVGDVSYIGRTAGQLQPIPLHCDPGDYYACGYFGSTSNGVFKSPYSGGALSSDRRLKYVGKESAAGLDKIKQLKVFNYTFKKDEKKTPQVGVIAQDLQKVFPDAVTKGQDGFLKIRWDDMFYALINAVKELDAKIVQLTETIRNNQNEIKKLKKENEELRNSLKQIQNDIKQLKSDKN